MSSNHDDGVGGTQRLASTISGAAVAGHRMRSTDNRARVGPGVWSVTGTGDGPDRADRAAAK